MISKAPSHLKSKEDHKTVRALYLETPEVMVSSVLIKRLVTFTYAVADEVSPVGNSCVSGVTFTQNTKPS